MHPSSHALVTREVLKAFDVDERDLEAAVAGAVEIDDEFRKLGGGTWAISHSFNEAGKLVPAMEGESVGPSDLTTFRVSHHLGGVYALLAYYAMPKPMGWRFLGQAFHIFQDMGTPPHSQFFNLLNMIQSLAKDGGHAQFEQILADHGDLGLPSIRKGIKYGLATELEPPLADTTALIIQDILLPDLSKWSALKQPILYDHLAELRAGLGGKEQVIAIGEECLEKTASYCVQLCLLLGMKPRVEPVTVSKP